MSRSRCDGPLSACVVLCPIAACAGLAVGTCLCCLWFSCSVCSQPLSRGDSTRGGSAAEDHFTLPRSRVASARRGAATRGREKGKKCGEDARGEMGCALRHLACASLLVRASGMPATRGVAPSVLEGGEDGGEKSFYPALSQGTPCGLPWPRNRLGHPTVAGPPTTLLPACLSVGARIRVRATRRI